MKPEAYLINVARGELVDEAALVRALREGWIAGAGIDVFECEPSARDNPLFAMDNVVLSSHNLATTDELTTAANRGAVNAVLDFAHHRIPTSLLNPGILTLPHFAGWEIA